MTNAGRIGIGAASIPGGQAELWVANDVTLIPGNYAGDVDAQIMAVGATNTNKRLALMYDTTLNIGLVQAMIYGTGTSRLCLNAAGGNVGIGKTNPATALDVTGTVTATALTGAGSGITALNMDNAGSGTLAVARGGTGTTTSTGTGSVVLSAGPTLTGTTSVATLVASGDITSSSDRRVKTGIKHIQGALDKVTQIGGYTFTRTDEPHEGQRQAGVIAQEIIEILPEVVQKSEETGYYSVSYGNITALLIEALKEERLERLKLEERLARLEKLVHDHPMK
jgi:hypothetical protein